MKEVVPGMQSTKIKKKNNLILVLVVTFVVVMLSYGSWTIYRMENYVKRAGVESMMTVMEQIEQNYSTQIQRVYSRLTRLERLLFKSEDRSISIEEKKSILSNATDNESEHILLIKDNGYVMEVNDEGYEDYYVDLQTGSMMKLKENQPIAQSIVNRQNEKYYLIAVPCESYEADGQQFSALGLLVDRSVFDKLLETDAYNGQAKLIVVDENGIITFTNMKGELYTRNYEILKHLEADNVISETQYERLETQMATGVGGVEEIEENGTAFYLGFQPLEFVDGTLICIVAQSEINGSLLEYQRIALRVIFIIIIVFMVLSIALLMVFSRAVSATHKAKCEEETIRVKEKAMETLETERDKANSANQAKSRFLANMSHDIRTPMNAIIGFTEIAKRQNADESVAHSLEKIDCSSKHLISLINDVLDMSYIESGKFALEETEVNLVEILREIEMVFSGQARAKHLRLHMDTFNIIDEDVICDKMRLTQVLMNLLSNAVKFTPDGGDISVGLEQLHSDREGMGLYEFRVKDSGIGMSREFTEHVFDAFEREQMDEGRKTQGTGLGMAIVKSIIDMMGGTIEVQSEQGKGTEFIINLQLPLKEKVADMNKLQEEAMTKIDAASDFKEKKMLLVEDNLLNREIAMEIFSDYGFEIDTAENGEEAFLKISDSKPGDYDLVIMDLKMPVMNGIEATKRIRALDNPELSAIPIIAMTANVFDEDRKKAADCGMNGFIVKPVNIDEIERELRKVLITEKM